MILKLKSQTGSRKGIEVLHGGLCCMTGTMDSFSYRNKMFFLMQNIFILPAMQHGCSAKPLYQDNFCQIPIWEIVSALWTGNLNLTKGEGLDMTS